VLADVKNWDIPEEESESYHKLVNLIIIIDKHNKQGNLYVGKRYRIKEHLLTKLNKELHSNIAIAFQQEDKHRNRRNR